MPLSRVLRSPANRVMYSVIGGVLIAAPAVGIVALLGSAGDPGAGRLLAVLAGLVLVGVAFLRLAAVRVVLSDEHVEVVNPLRRYRVRWADVEDIDITAAGGWIVRLWIEGEPRWVWGLSRFGQFGALPFASRHDDPAKDAPRWVYDGYRELRRTWTARTS
ncbi:PH domain-containing protein [Dactylosporangium salmoneum]|uniref:Low molecular weight protein antigen 6 PH domain-containing protein n=1 Tax=Dactylosporangium salmoneum TaxID=53361 RepID=A0ABP5T324_9ACTN